jgi:undecaprenyl-diphosphatase
MTPEAVARLVASHPIALLLTIVAATMAATALLWHLVHRHGPGTWRLIAQLWALLAGSPLARRFADVPLMGRLLRGTLTVGRYLGLYTVAAFAVAVAGLSLFFEIADGIGADDELARFDETLTAALRDHVSRETLLLFALITRLGDRTFLVLVGAAVMVVLLLVRRWLLAMAWAGGTASGGALNSVLKAIFERARPLHEHGAAVAEGWSFPSGHAFGAVLVYGLLGYLLVLSTRPAWHAPIAALSICVVVFVGFSRVILQVHYLSDVLAGYATGVGWVALCIAGLEAVRWRRAAVPGASNRHTGSA